MARRTRRTVEDDTNTQENAVTDTQNTELDFDAEVEAAEGYDPNTAPPEQYTSGDEPATAPPQAVAADEAAEPEAEPVDHVAELHRAIVEFGDDRDRAKLQETYRAIAPAGRAKVQNEAMKLALTDDTNPIDPGVLGEVLEAFTNLPSASKARKAPEQLDPTTEGAIKVMALQNAAEALRNDVGEDAWNLADRWLQDAVPAKVEGRVDQAMERVITAVNKTRGGGGGPRSRFTEKVSDLIADGRLAVGTELTGANGVTATVVEGGLETAGEVFENPSAAAKAHRTDNEGKSTSTNGWDFWKLEDGTAIGELRKA